MAFFPLPRVAPWLLAGILLGAPAAPGQTLAHPGWAGSGLNGEPWWRSAVFYRLDPRTFQDSDGDGIGDLPGLTSRLDYLQTLGVDALILEGVPRPGTVLTTKSAPPLPAALLPFALIDEPGFDDLLNEASRRHLRIVIAQPLSADPTTLLARARSALTRGAAGIELTPFPSLPAPTPAATTGAYLLPELRSLAASFPGERVILSDLDAAPLAPGAPHPLRRLSALSPHGEAPQLTALSLANQPLGPSEAAAALRLLVSTSESLPSGAAPLFQAEGRSPAPADALSRALPLPVAAFLAERLLTLRGALTVEAGQELGLAAASANPAAAANAAPALLMQWTPRNITPPAVTIDPNPDPAPVRSDIYGAYRPYVPVKPKAITLPGATPPPPEPDALPGFTSGPLPASPAPGLDTARRNVAVEDLDPHSLLNLYRRLIALHNGHATLRTGSTAVLELTGTAVVWVRRAPAGARTVASVIMACNLSDAPLSLSLDAELERAHIRPGLLRPLLGTAAAPNGPQSTAALALPAHGLYIGEIYHH